MRSIKMISAGVLLSVLAAASPPKPPPTMTILGCDMLTSTISSPIQVHGVTKVPARRAPELGEHTEEVLHELGFDAEGIDALRASGAVPKTKERAA